MNGETSEQILTRLRREQRLWLFLDYDGTLADFAPTPDDIYPDVTLQKLLGKLAAKESIRVTILSGRRLGHIQNLLPVPGLWLSGAYGVEWRHPETGQMRRIAYDQVRPTLEKLKPRWEARLKGKDGFYLEDKGWALAIHARFADDQLAEQVLQAARGDFDPEAMPEFRLLGGHKFLEIGPKIAHKGHTVEYFLEQYAWPGALPVYFGDDDKDEEAFGVIQTHGGLAILIALEDRPSQADYRLQSPHQVRELLQELESGFD